MSKKRYRVQNPRSIPAESPVVSIGGKHYREGQVVRVEESEVADLLERGFLKEVQRKEDSDG